MQQRANKRNNKVVMLGKAFSSLAPALKGSNFSQQSGKCNMGNDVHWNKYEFSFPVYVWAWNQPCCCFNMYPNCQHILVQLIFPMLFYNAICHDLNTRVSCANPPKRSTAVDLDRCYLALEDNFKARQMEDSVMWIGPKIKYWSYRSKNGRLVTQLEPNQKRRRQFEWFP